MLNIKGSPSLRKVVVLNPKGGSGKTTLAFNIAGYIAATGRKVALIDMDPQRNSTFWIQNRPARLPAIYGVSAADPDSEMESTSKAIELPDDIDFAVIDAPGAVPTRLLADYTVGSHAILVPVMPSDLDIHAASRLIKDLLLVARVSRANRRLGVIPNRVRRNTLAYRRLMKFLNQLSIAVVGVIRDSQNYVTAAHRGMCIHELPPSQAKKDLLEWETITAWLEQRLSTPLNERDLRRPPARTGTADKPRRRLVPLAVAASLGGLLGLAVNFWLVQPRQDGARTPELTMASTVAAAATSADPVDARDLRATTLELSAEPTDTPTDDLNFVAKLDDLLVESDEGPPSADLMREKWQLSGVAQSGDTNVVLLTDRSSRTTYRALPDADIDGWLVAETGSDYAVLKHGDEVVRLKLNNLSTGLSTD